MWSRWQHQKLQNFRKIPNPVSTFVGDLVGVFTLGGGGGGLDFPAVFGVFAFFLPILGSYDELPGGFAIIYHRTGGTNVTNVNKCSPLPLHNKRIVESTPPYYIVEPAVYTPL